MHGVSHGMWLWAGLFLLGFAAAARLTWGWLRTCSDERSGPLPPMLCPSCRRSYPAGVQRCMLDGARLQPLSEGAQPGAVEGRGGKCPQCRRAFEAGMRFCPMDAEELVPLGLWQATHAEGGVHVESFSDHLLAGRAKICPMCATKYDLEAWYCGRDASELVTIN